MLCRGVWSLCNIMMLVNPSLTLYTTTPHHTTVIPPFTSHDHFILPDNVLPPLVLFPPHTGEVTGDLALACVLFVPWAMKRGRRSLLSDDIDVISKDPIHGVNQLNRSVECVCISGCIKYMLVSALEHVSKRMYQNTHLRVIHYEISRMILQCNQYVCVFVCGGRGVSCLCEGAGGGGVMGVCSCVGGGWCHLDPLRRIAS